jgi:G3E family GTPase
MGKLVEVYLLSGFLGSGKTTLLKHLLKEEQKQGRFPAVLMNELGEVSIDSNAIDDRTPLKELMGGCVCCTLSDQVEAQIADLLRTYPIDAIYIETTGAAHPVETLDAVMSPLYAGQLQFKGIITVIDVLRWKERSQLSPQVLQLYREQIAHADLLIVNKTDLVSEFELSTFVYEIQQVNSHATCVFTQHANISINQLKKLKRVQQGHHETTHHHHLHLQSVVYEFSKPIEQIQFEEWIRSLPSTVYRMKGYVAFTHSSYPFLFQYSYGMPVYMPEYMKMPLTLVIIGEELDQERLYSQLKKLEQS